MSQPVVDRSPRRRVRWACRCGFPLVAGPQRAGAIQPALTRFFAGGKHNAVKSGARLASCPRCGQALPAIVWQQFEDEHLAAAFGP